jgi:hypothetical protein
MTPLTEGSKEGENAVLAKDGIDLNPVNTIYGRTPLLQAVIYRQKQIAESLLMKDGVNRYL